MAGRNGNTGVAGKEIEESGPSGRRYLPDGPGSGVEKVMIDRLRNECS
jgi:hypothetical protein